jgi:hypothetical protein
MTKLEARTYAAESFRHSSFGLPSSFGIRALSFASFVQKREHKFGFGDDCIIDDTVAFRFGQAFAA